MQPPNLPSLWKCPEGCPYQSSNAWAVVKVAGYLVAITVTVAIAVKGEDMEPAAKAALYAMGVGGTGLALDGKRFKEDALSFALKQFLGGSKDSGKT